jgi:flagellar hook-length control protein FliK
MKGGDGEAVIRSKTRLGAAQAARGAPASDGEKAADRKPTNLQAKAPPSRRAEVLGAPAVPKEARRSAQAARDDKAHEHSPSSGQAVPAETKAKVAKATDDDRSARTKRDAALDESGSILASGSGLAARALSADASVMRAKGAPSGGREDPAAGQKAERLSSEPKLSVRDLRRSTDAKGGAASKPALKPEDPSGGSIQQSKSSSHETGREVYRELSLGARGTGDSSMPASAGKADAAGGRGQDFGSMLADRLRDAWNGEIVQSARIVLKDGDAGTIRLRLKPESLGNVKIELNLSENNISGRILVESDKAKSAFERNMNQLADAFKQGGFDSASLEVAVGGGSGGGSPNDSSRKGSPEPFFSERLRGAVGSTADPAAAVTAYSRRGGSIDIYA